MGCASAKHVATVQNEEEAQKGKNYQNGDVFGGECLHTLLWAWQFQAFFTWVAVSNLTDSCLLPLGQSGGEA